MSTPLRLRHWSAHVEIIASHFRWQSSISLLIYHAWFLMKSVAQYFKESLPENSRIPGIAITCAHEQKLNQTTIAYCYIAVNTGFIGIQRVGCLSNLITTPVVAGMFIGLLISVDIRTSSPTSRVVQVASRHELRVVLHTGLWYLPCFNAGQIYSHCTPSFAACINTDKSVCHHCVCRLC